MKKTFLIYEILFKEMIRNISKNTRIRPRIFLTISLSVFLVLYVAMFLYMKEISSNKLYELTDAGIVDITKLTIYQGIIYGGIFIGFIKYFDRKTKSFEFLLLTTPISNFSLKTVKYLSDLTIAVVINAVLSIFLIIGQSAMINDFLIFFKLTYLFWISFLVLFTIYTILLNMLEKILYYLKFEQNIIRIVQSTSVLAISVYLFITISVAQNITFFDDYIINEKNLFGEIILGILVYFIFAFIAVISYSVNLGSSTKNILILNGIFSKIGFLRKTILMLIRIPEFFEAFFYIALVNILFFINTGELTFKAESFLFLTFVFIQYYDATLSDRKLNKLYNLSVLQEIIFIAGITILIVGIDFVISQGKKFDFNYLLIFWIFIMFGSLFPKKNSSMNNNISNISAIFIVAISSLLLNVVALQYQDLVKIGITIVFIYLTYKILIFEEKEV